MRRLLVLIALLVVLVGLGGGIQKYFPQISKSLQKGSSSVLPSEKVKIVTEESVVIDVVKKQGPSVVTVAETLPQNSVSPFDLGPFSIFGQPQLPDNSQNNQPQNIGSGFIVSAEGFVVTNKHVVSDTEGKYQVITSDGKKYDVQKIYRDPFNDVAIIKVDPSQNAVQFTPIELGDSSKLQVGQFVIAIGTALGEFRNTVTTGVISGLGRGITAGDQFQGQAEDLNNVVQTSAAINPGNSGGPLLNSSGQVIGVNTAVAQSGQNIGFALPINVIKDSLKNFNETGQFNRPYLGIAYKMIARDLAILNNLPEGAYVQQVVVGAAADKAGVKKGDIITEIDNQRIQGDNNQNIASIISKKKVGDTVALKVWRNGKTMDLSATLQTAPNQ